MDTNRIPQQALQFRPKGWRNIGRPKKGWSNQLHFEDQGTGNTPNPSWTWWWWWWWWWWKEGMMGNWRDYTTCTWSEWTKVDRIWTGHLLKTHLKWHHSIKWNALLKLLLYYISQLRTNRLTRNLNEGIIRHPTLVHTEESCEHFIFSVMAHGMLISLL